MALIEIDGLPNLKSWDFSMAMFKKTDGKSHDIMHLIPMK